MTRTLIFVFLAAFIAANVFAADKSRQWALYSWIETDGWHYSLIHRTDHHPDDSEVKSSSTANLGAIESRISLLEPGSDVTLNPLPVLNMEFHRPPYTTQMEFERVCENAKLTWGEGN